MLQYKVQCGHLEKEQEYNGLRIGSVRTASFIQAKE